MLKHSYVLTNYLKLQILDSYNNLRIGQGSEFANFCPRGQCKNWPCCYLLPPKLWVKIQCSLHSCVRSLYCLGIFSHGRSLSYSRVPNIRLLLPLSLTGMLFFFKSKIHPTLWFSKCQLISKYPFAVIVGTKIPTKNLTNFCSRIWKVVKSTK